MTRRPTTPPAPAFDVAHGRMPGFQTLPDLLELIAQRMRADAIQLGIDHGTGYRRDYFIEQTADAALLSDLAAPPFVIMRETRIQRHASPAGLIATPEWVDQHPLPVGTAGRRKAPRSGIALMRSPSRPAFKPSERRQFSKLLPQLNCAIALAYELECARQREACALAMLEQANYGFLVLGLDGMPLHGNRLAFELLEQARVRVGKRLHLPTRLLQSRFDATLAHAGIPGNPGATLLVPGPPPVIMALRHTLPGAPSGGSLPATLTLTLQGHRAVAQLPDCVAQHFGLTPAEFKLCAALAGGASLKACAKEWNRSYDTLRSQLKTILAKTGTHRQAELIALLNAFKP